MKRPDSPTVPMSEPEEEQRVMEFAMEKLSNPDGIMKVYPLAVPEQLDDTNLKIDGEGFVVNEDTGEYAESYGFSRDMFEQTESPVDDVFEAYFVSVEDMHEGFITQRERLHLSDVHAFVSDENGDYHPVEDKITMMEQFHAHTGHHFGCVMAWSDVLEMAHGGALQDEVSVHLRRGFRDTELDLSCLNPGCEYTGDASEWNGDLDDPECPECGGHWTETVTVCTSCQEWHWGVNFDGGGIHSEPVCPHCDGGMQFLEEQTRYNIPDGMEGDE